jgi:hypothetical protein
VADREIKKKGYAETGPPNSPHLHNSRVLDVVFFKLFNACDKINNRKIRSAEF